MRLGIRLLQIGRFVLWSASEIYLVELKLGNKSSAELNRKRKKKHIRSSVEEMKIIHVFRGIDIST